MIFRDFDAVYVNFSREFLICILGELDKETEETMMLPRCGVKDKVGPGSDSRSKRYALQGNHEKKLTLVS